MGFIKRIKDIIKANSNAEIEPQDLNAKSSLFDLHTNDIISILGVDYEIKGAIVYNDQGYKWIEYKLKDSRKTYWLSIEQDDDLEIKFYKEVVAITTDTPKSIDYKGTKYYMQEGSDAIVESVEGSINTLKGSQVDYFEYSDEDDENLLSIEIWNGEIEMSVGKWIEEYNIEIFSRK